MPDSPPPASLLGAKRPCLVVVAGFGSGRIFPLKLKTTIGRGPENDVVLPYPTVSWNHAVVSWRDGVVAVRDLGSRNGTLIGVEKVRYRELVEGDVVAIGDTMVFKLVHLADDELARGPLASSNQRDPVTGAVNVASLLDRLRIEQSLPHENDLPIILTLFRVVGLEEFDEDAMVEKAMAKAARAIQASMRCDVVLARSGHDEFIALTRTVPSLAREMADRARSEVAKRGSRLSWRAARSCSLAAAIVPLLPRNELSAEEVLTTIRARAQSVLSTAANETIVLAAAEAEDGGSF